MKYVKYPTQKHATTQDSNEPSPFSGIEIFLSGQHDDIELNYLISSSIINNLIYICDKATMTDTIIYLCTALKSTFL
jgi:hypothetical protein